MAVFTVPFAYTGAANVDLLEMVAPTAKGLILLGFDIGQISLLERCAAGNRAHTVGRP